MPQNYVVGRKVSFSVKEVRILEFIYIDGQGMIFPSTVIPMNEISQVNLNHNVKEQAT